MGHDIRYVPRTAIKSQALADFITEWTEVQLPTLDVTHEYWMMYFDGSIMAPGSGARVVLMSPNGSRLRYMTRLHFLASNNPWSTRHSSTDCASPLSLAPRGYISVAT